MINDAQHHVSGNNATVYLQLNCCFGVGQTTKNADAFATSNGFVVQDCFEYRPSPADLPGRSTKFQNSFLHEGGTISPDTSALTPDFNGKLRIFAEIIQQRESDCTPSINLALRQFCARLDHSHCIIYVYVSSQHKHF